ncbi:uncharacterized protein LOC109727716 [Ananas comosus]|uniref:Uncharacterized protein LOC109727716 n=1 Tax=Ananas comosus TaxID=4615 RepID=A0A6P5H974_ANACO|nr:uncharacterized protein LOC109727716 [Ananas comosus]
MATLSSPPCSLHPTLRRALSPPPLSLALLPFLRLPRRGALSSSPPRARRPLLGSRRVATRAVAEEEAAAAAEVAEEEGASSSADQGVSVPVSPSDMLTMFFKAEGTLDESSIPAVTKALEVIEGISDLSVQVAEGIASVELTKQTTVQATGVASNLVEIIQGSGFRLQTLSLSFKDEEDAM